MKNNRLSYVAVVNSNVSGEPKKYTPATFVDISVLRANVA